MRFRGGLAGLLLLLSGVPALGQTGVALNCFDSSVAPPWKPCSSTNPLYVNISGGSLTVTSDATATAAAPSYSEGTANPLSQTLAGNLRTTGVGGSFPITAASGAIASGAVASGAIASGAVASGAYASGALASGSIASGAMVDLVALSAPVSPATATATKSILLGTQATTGAVNPTNGQQSALSSDTNNNVLVSAGGAPNLAVTQVSVATSDTAVVSARALRRAVTIQQITGTQNVFCNQTTATAGNGVVLPAVVGASFTFNTTSAVRCIAITGAQTVAVAETF